MGRQKVEGPARRRFSERADVGQGLRPTGP